MIRFWRIIKESPGWFCFGLLIWSIIAFSVHMAVLASQKDSWSSMDSAFTTAVDDPLSLSGILLVRGRIDGEGFQKVTQWVDSVTWGRVKQITVDLHSGGGAIFEGVRAVDEMNYWKSKGIKVVTRTRSIAASAAAYVFIHGDHRIMSKNAFLMHHSLQLPAYYTPSTSEKIALVQIQEMVNKAWIQRSNFKERVASALFWIPYGSDKQVWLNAAWAKYYGLVEEIEQ